jgi:SNF2 family DNA or RNA helicase
MGLGKTVQTIAFLAWLKHQRKGKVISRRDDEKNFVNLIVVPASVLSNWMNEFKKFAPNMKGEYESVSVRNNCIRYSFLIMNIVSYSFEIPRQSKGEGADSRWYRSLPERGAKA